MVNACLEEKFVTISPTMVKDTGFNVLDSQTPGASVLVGSNGHICIEDT